MPLNVLVTMPWSDAIIERLRQVSPELNVQRAKADEADYSEVEVIYGTSTPDLAKAPKLKWVAFHFAGMDALYSHPVYKTDITLTTSSGTHGTAVGQFAVVMLLSLAYKVPDFMRWQAEAKWPDGDRRRSLLPLPVRDTTVGILGYGSIGREVARLLKPFGPRLVVTKRDIVQRADTGYHKPGMGDPGGTLPDEWVPIERLQDFLAQCDYVVNCLPYTPATDKILDAAAIAAMKPNAFLINIGRGTTIDQPTLVDALRNRRIAGAALDVFEPEPLPPGDPVYSLDNVILSPHLSGFMPGFDVQASELFAVNLGRYLRGEPLYNQVDRTLGY